MNWRLILFIIALLGLGGWFLLAPGEETAPVLAPASTGSWNWGFVVIALIVTAALVALAIWQRAHLWPAMQGHPKIALFVAWTVFLYVAAVTLHQETRDWLLTPTGFGLLMLLIAMVVLLCLGVEILKESWMTVAVYVLLTIAVVDPGILRQMPPGFKALFKGPNLGGGVVRTSATAGACDGNRFPGKQVATPQEQPLPRNAKINITVHCGVVRLDGYGGYEDIDPSGVIRSNIAAPTWRALTIRSLTQQAFYTLSL